MQLNREDTTKRDIQIAFCQLLEEEPFDLISVGEVCQKARVSPHRFYSYYHDRYDLLAGVLREYNALREEMNQPHFQISQLEIHEWEQTFEQIF